MKATPQEQERNDKEREERERIQTTAEEEREKTREYVPTPGSQTRSGMYVVAHRRRRPEFHGQQELYRARSLKYTAHYCSGVGCRKDAYFTDDPMVVRDPEVSVDRLRELHAAGEIVGASLAWSTLVEIFVSYSSVE